MPVANNQLNLNSSIINFRLPSIDGREYSPEDFSDYKVLVIIFMCNHCPYVQAVIPRIVRLQREYEERGVKFIGINSNDSKEYPEDTTEKMKIYYEKWKMNFPYLRDKSQEVARQYDAVCTPDIYVYDKKRILKYRGRIDDNWKDESLVTRQELKEAIESILEDREVSSEQNPSMGCSIKWIKN